MKSSSSLEHSADETMSSVVWHVKGRNEGNRTERKKNKILASQEADTEAAKYPREKKVSEFQKFKNICTKHSRYACVNVPSRELESPVGAIVLILLSISGVLRCGVPARLFSLAGGPCCAVEHSKYSRL